MPNEPQDKTSQAERDAPSHAPVTAHFLTHVAAAAFDRDAPLLRRLLNPLDPADFADVLDRLPGEARTIAARLIGAEIPAAVIAELAYETREDLLSHLSPERVAQVLGELDSDDAAMVADDLDADMRENVLAQTPDEVRLAVEEGLAFDEETAGRLMQREFVAAPEFWTVGHAIDHLRAGSDDDLPSVFFEIYVVDPGFRPIGAAPVSTLLRAKRDTLIRDIMRPSKHLVRQDMDQEEVAYIFQQYRLASAPVVDEAGRLKGMVTIDDIVDVIQEENKEDLLNLAGVSEAGQADTVARSVRARAPWLLVNLGTALIGSFVISSFGASIEKAVALAVLMPLVASIGGNAGTQALAVAVRAIAARELNFDNAPRFIVREALTGAANGVLFAGLLALVAGLWFHDWRISLAIASAITINLSAAGLAGILAPLTLKRAGADPAVASAVFVTFVTDVVGFLSFLGLATVFLGTG